MKKLFILTVFCFVTFTSAYAQMQIGPKVGGTFFRQGLSTVGSDNFSTSFVPGFTAGVGAEYTFGGRFSLAVDGLYAQKGSFFQSKIPINLTSGNLPAANYVEFQDRLNYLNFPVYAKYYLRGKDFGMNLQAGMELGFMMSANQTKAKLTNPADATNFVELAKYSYNIGDGPNDDYLGSDFGLFLGAGFFYEMDAGRIIVDLRYHHGTSNVIRTSFETEERTNRGISLTVGYMFPLGGGF